MHVQYPHVINSETDSNALNRSCLDKKPVETGFLWLEEVPQFYIFSHVLYIKTESDQSLRTQKQLSHICRYTL